MWNICLRYPNVSFLRIALGVFPLSLYTEISITTSLSINTILFMRKAISMLLFLLLASGMTSAQSPEKFSSQSIIRAVGGQALTNQPIGMRLSILKGSDNGTTVYV